MTVGSLMRQPTGYLPVAMSVGAFAMIVWFVAVHGIVHQPDEGAQAHLWQLLVAGQVPLIAYFAFRWLPSARRQALVVLALQAAALVLLQWPPCGCSAAYSSRLPYLRSRVCGRSVRATSNSIRTEWTARDQRARRCPPDWRLVASQLR